MSNLSQRTEPFNQQQLDYWVSGDFFPFEMSAVRLPEKSKLMCAVLKLRRVLLDGREMLETVRWSESNRMWSYFFPFDWSWCSVTSLIKTLKLKVWTQPNSSSPLKETVSDRGLFKAVWNCLQISVLLNYKSNTNLKIKSVTNY